MDQEKDEVVQSEDVLKDLAGTPTHDAIKVYRSYNATDLAAIETRLRRKLDLVCCDLALLPSLNY